MLDLFDLLPKHVADVFPANLQEALALFRLLLFQGKLDLDTQPLLQRDDSLGIRRAHLHLYGCILGQRCQIVQQVGRGQLFASRPIQDGGERCVENLGA